MTNTSCAARSLLCSLWLCTVAVSCRTTPTEIELFIDSDAPASRTLRLQIRSFPGSVGPAELMARVMADGRVSETLLTRDTTGNGTLVLPGSVGILPIRPADTNTVTVWLRATVGSTPTSPEIRMDRAARFSFVRGQRGTARLFLPIRCGDSAAGCTSVVASECTVSVRCREQNTTCGDRGECVAPDLGVSFPGQDVSLVPSTDASQDVPMVPPRDARSVGAPRPIAPLSLGNVTRSTPTFRWELTAPLDGAVLQLCRDRACTQVIESVRAVGATSGRPLMPLPARSVVYWRLRGLTGSIESAEWSPTWMFHVPVRDAPNGIDTSYSAHLDLNGDGFDDVVVGSFAANPGGRVNAGAASVFHGSPTGVSTTPLRVLEGLVRDDTFGYSVANAGDLNGDGFGDLAIGAQDAAPMGRMGAGSVAVFYGGPGGVGGTADALLAGAAVDDGFGYSVAGAGDVNRDGFGDLIVGAPSADSGGQMASGAASIFLGSAAGISTTPARVLPGVGMLENFGNAVATAGDVNGDGYGDILVGGPFGERVGPPVAGFVSVHYGSRDGIGATPNRVLEGVASADSFGWGIGCAGDVNGDGFADVIVGAYGADPMGRTNAGSAYIFHGSATGLGATAIRIIAEGLAQDGMGGAVAGAGDLDGDGFGEVLVGSHSADPGGRMSAGTARVLIGQAGGIFGSPVRTYDGILAGDSLGQSIAGAGDLNGDGYADLLVGANRASPMGRAFAGSVNVYYGSAMGASVAPRVVLEGAAAGDNFGFSIGR